MRRLLAFLIEMLPLDPAGRRAMKETFADWRHEDALAHSSLERAGVHALGLLAVASVLARTVAADLARPHTLRISIETLGLSVLIALAVMVAQFSPWLASGADNEAGLVFAAVVAFLPTALLAGLPIGALTPILRDRNSRSLLGAGIVLTLLAAINVAWIAPTANQEFRRAILWAQPQLQPYPATPEAIERQVQDTTGLAELTAIELMEMRGSGRVSDIRLARTLNARAAYVLMVPVCLLLGAQARRFAAAWGWVSGGRLVAWSAALLAWGGAALGGSFAYAAVRDVSSAASAQLQVYYIWLSPLAVALAAVFLAWAASRPDENGRMAAGITRA